MPLTRIPGATNRIENRVTRRSKGARSFRVFRTVELRTRGLEAIFFHPPVKGTAAQAECFCRLAHVSLKALRSFADQDTVNRLQTQFLQILGWPAWRNRCEVGRVN